MLQSYIGLTESYAWDSTHFLKKLGGLVLNPGDVMVSFDVVSLFTVVPIQEVLGHIANLFLADVTVLFQQVLMTIYF